VQVSNRVPRDVFEALYGITLPAPAMHEPADRPPTSRELLNCFASACCCCCWWWWWWTGSDRTGTVARGLMSPHGLPDDARAARRILKDYVNARSLVLRSRPVAHG
jgi:hypothetical protein